MARMPTSEPQNAELLSPNQVVAYNLAKARALRGWTQEQAAERLEAHLGERWSKATWSVAERSVDGVRLREFTANELVALSQTFMVPIVWWFLPPGADRPDAKIAIGEGGAGAHQAELVGVHLGHEGGQEVYEQRLADLLDWLGIPGTDPARIWHRIIDRLRRPSGGDEVAGLVTGLRSLLTAAEAELNDEEADR